MCRSDKSRWFRARKHLLRLRLLGQGCSGAALWLRRLVFVGVRLLALNRQRRRNTAVNLNLSLR